MSINEGLLVHTLDICKKLEGPNVSKEPDAWRHGWYQGSWRCQTGLCFAGQAAELSGREWVSPNPNDTLSDAIIATPEEVATQKTFTAKVALKIDGKWKKIDMSYLPVRTVAEDLLGIDNETAGLLFAGDNTLDDLEDYVGQIIEYGHIVNEIMRCEGCGELQAYCICPEDDD